MPEVIDPCVYCGESTAFGSGRFVNRIGVDDGWGCAECSGFECDACDQQIVLDCDFGDRNGEGHYHYACVPLVENADENGMTLNLSSYEVETLSGYLGELVERDGNEVVVKIYEAVSNWLTEQEN